MNALDRKAADLHDLVEDVVNQFKFVDSAIASAPFVDLNLQELRVVEVIGRQGPRMMRELAESLAVAVNSATGIVDGLETKGLVRRLRSAEDRRVVRVELADAGRAAYQASVDVHFRFLRAMLHELTDEEQDIFMVLFRKIARGGRSQVQKMAAPA
ncbi:MAG: MarR family transcriptional regulator [Planctomycetia bacterium]